MPAEDLRHRINRRGREEGRGVPTTVGAVGVRATVHRVVAAVHIDAVELISVELATVELAAAGVAAVGLPAVELTGITDPGLVGADPGAPPCGNNGRRRRRQSQLASVIDPSHIPHRALLDCLQ